MSYEYQIGLQAGYFDAKNQRPEQPSRVAVIRHGDDYRLGYRDGYEKYRRIEDFRIERAANGTIKAPASWYLH